MPGLIIGDEIVEVPGAEVRNYEDDHAHRFTRAFGGVRPTKHQPDLIVIHFTAAENGMPGFFRNIGSRKTRDGRGLSVHLFTDYAGVTWQLAAFNEICRHAGVANSRGGIPSIGWEIQSRGVDRGGIYDGKGPAASTMRRWRKKYPRGVYLDTVQGKEKHFATYTADQLDAVSAIASVLCDELRIPARIPAWAAPKGGGSGYVFRKRLPTHYFRQFQGVIGHYHCHKTKVDPGTQVLEELVNDGFRLDPVPV